MRISSVFFDKLRKLDLPLGIFFPCEEALHDAQYCTESQLLWHWKSRKFSYTKKNEVTLCKI
ncbi:hypothetical protein PU01_22945 [Hafnia alvei]|nr:hypothetical protein PU01_22945 [Hafnia alvei]PNK70581.1 hypothetical protein A6J69_000265 [Hafnia paralvei]